MVNENLLMMAKKTKEKHIAKTFEFYNSCIMNFDLWMSRAKVNKFVLIVHFLNEKWEPCHVITIRFFEMTNTFGSAMTLQVNELLTKHRFNSQVIIYVKDDKDNFSTMTILY